MTFNEKLTDYFQKKQSLSIKKNNVFSSDYIPDEVLHRIKQCREIGKYILNKDNVVITGAVSTGKTVCIRKVFEVLPTAQPKWKFIYHNCKDTARKDIYRSIIENLGGKVASRGIGISDYREKVGVISKDVERIVLCLDEVDDLCKRYDPKTLFYDFSNDPKYGLIFISNNISWYQSLDVKVVSRLQSSVINFELYTEDEIIDILRDRISKGLERNILFPSEIENIARFSNQQLDKLRVGLKALSDIIDWKVTKEKEKIELTKEQIETFFVKINETTKYLFFENFPPEYKLLMLIIAELSTENETVDISTITKLWNKNTSDKYGIVAQSPDSIRIYLDRLESHGFVRRGKGISNTGKGRPRYIYEPLYDTETYITLFNMNDEDRMDEMIKLTKESFTQKR